MGFPQTRLTVIQRLASGGSEQDWRDFLSDYWGPICRFSLRRGAANLPDAEEVASEVFAVLWETRLLARWVSQRSARLRTLLCSVTRKVLSQQHRVRARRNLLWRDFVDQIDRRGSEEEEQADVFYVSWVEDMLQQSVEALGAECGRRGQGDLVRVLYGRLCQGLKSSKVAEALGMTPAAADHCFRAARDRLAEKLQELVRRQVGRYCPVEQVAEEYALEWKRLGRHLAESGGLEEALRRAYSLLDPVRAQQTRAEGLTRAVTRMTAVLRTPPPPAAQA